MRNIKLHVYRSDVKRHERRETDKIWEISIGGNSNPGNFVEVSGEWSSPGELIAANKYKSFNFRIEIVENFNGGHKLAIVNDRA